MKRHPSLHPLSEHHHHALVQALQIRRADDSSPTERAAALRAAADNLLHFWEDNGRQHFREEEEILLPAYARHVRLDENAAVIRMLAEHALIRGEMEDLGKALERGSLKEQNVLALGELLQGHVRLEEDEIFPAIETALGEEGMAALADRFTRLYSETENEKT